MSYVLFAFAFFIIDSCVNSLVLKPFDCAQGDIFIACLLPFFLYYITNCLLKIIYLFALNFLVSCRLVRISNTSSKIKGEKYKFKFTSFSYFVFLISHLDFGYALLYILFSFFFFNCLASWFKHKFKFSKVLVGRWFIC